MSTHDKEAKIVHAMEVTEGGGVTVHRTIGTPALRNYDPFLMLDHISSDNPDDYIAGFPSHPHRGFNTFTYMIDGDMQHKDSMGNTGNLGSGGAQWMKAASGVIHSEMPKQEDGLLRGFQLWINLPAANKMDDPEYQEFTSDAFPIVEETDARVKVIMGRYADAVAPIEDQITNVSFLDVRLAAAKEFKLNVAEGENSFLYVFEGNAQLNSQTIVSHTLATLSANKTLSSIVAGKEGVRFLLVSGRPINESIVQYGPFVMNTKEEIDEAINDYHANRLVRQRAEMKRG